MIEISPAERLARAVLLFYRGGPWTETDRNLWLHYTGERDATTKTLCDLARTVRQQEERAAEIRRVAGTEPESEAEDPRTWPTPRKGLGPCCICGHETNVVNVVLLPVKGVIPGHGWGCVVCDLAWDGASAVVCNACIPAYSAGRAPLRFACQGYPGTEGRIAIERLTEPHVHNPEVEH